MLLLTFVLIKVGCLLLATLNLQPRALDGLCRGKFNASFFLGLFHRSHSLSDGIALIADGLGSLMNRFLPPGKFSNSLHVPFTSPSISSTETLGFTPIEPWGVTFLTSSPLGSTPIPDKFFHLALLASCTRPRTSLAVTGFTSPVVVVCLGPRQPSRLPRPSLTSRLSALSIRLHVIATPARSAARVLHTVSVHAFSSTLNAFVSSFRGIAFDFAFVVANLVLTEVILPWLVWLVINAAIGMAIRLTIFLRDLLDLQKWMVDSISLSLVRILTLG